MPVLPLLLANRKSFPRRAGAKLFNPMKPSSTYIASKLLTGDCELLRQHALTRWMSRDLMQLAVDLCRNLGLVPCYCECSPDHLTRYLFWRLPQGAGTEVRSGRTRDKFEALERLSRDQGRRLLSLHINESELYSAVWVTSDAFETAKAFLLAHGITTAERHDA